MHRVIASLVGLTLFPCVALSGTLCVQLNDNGDVLVMKGIGKGSKAVSGYLAEYAGSGRFLPKPVSGSSLQDQDGTLWVGLTEFEIGPRGFSENMAFHRIQCDAGSDKKLGVLDPCNDIVKNTDTLPSQKYRLGHVIPCIPEVRFP